MSSNNKIESINLPFLTDFIKNLLIKQQIITVIDFLKEDTHKIVQCQLTMKEINHVKSYIYDNYGTKIQTGYELYNQFQNNTFSFKTDIER